MAAEETRQIDVRRSLPRTAIVVSARNPVAFRPSGSIALPYWNSDIGHKSFRHCSRLRQSVPLMLPYTRTFESRLAWLGSTMVEKKIPPPARHPKIEELLSPASLARFPPRSRRYT